MAHQRLPNTNYFAANFFHIKYFYASFSMLSGSIFFCYDMPPELEWFIKKINLFLTVLEVVKSKAEEQCLVRGIVQ